MRTPVLDLILEFKSIKISAKKITMREKIRNIAFKFQFLVRDFDMISSFGYHFCYDRSSFGVRFGLHLRTCPSLTYGTYTSGSKSDLSKHFLISD